MRRGKSRKERPSRNTRGERRLWGHLTTLFLSETESGSIFTHCFVHGEAGGPKSPWLALLRGRRMFGAAKRLYKSLTKSREALGSSTRDGHRSKALIELYNSIRSDCRESCVVGGASQLQELLFPSGYIHRNSTHYREAGPSAVRQASSVVSLPDRLPFLGRLTREAGLESYEGSVARAICVGKRERSEVNEAGSMRLGHWQGIEQVGGRGQTAAASCPSVGTSCLQAQDVKSILGELFGRTLRIAAGRARAESEGSFAQAVAFFWWGARDTSTLEHTSGSFTLQIFAPGMQRQQNASTRSIARQLSP